MDFLRKLFRFREAIGIGDAVVAAFRQNQTFDYLTDQVTFNADASLGAFGLSVDVEKDGVYVIEGFFPLSIASATEGIQFDLAGGSTSVLATGRYRYVFSNATAVETLTARDIDDAASSTTAAWRLCLLTGLFVCDTTGTLAPRAAQASSGATASTIQAHAYFRATRVQ